MTREQMMNEIIRQYGFENATTITFCALAEDASVATAELQKAFDALMA